MASSPLKAHGSSPITGTSSRTRQSALAIPSLININTAKSKTNKFSVPSDLKFNTKSQKDGKDSVTNTPEFYLLNRLFLPSKYLIKNDSISIKQLLNHLPVIISRDASIQGSQLNLQLHLFLSSIVTEYVTSWYFTKLNTDNAEFIQMLYQVLCEFVQDLSTRVNAVLNPENIVQLIDDMSGIINQHFKSLHTYTDDPFHIKLVSDYNNHYETSNISRDNKKSLESTIQDYLRLNHVIFNSISSDGKEQELVYFRILTTKILTYSFRSSQDESSELLNGVLGSEITMNLVASLVSELVLENLLKKLSSPEFLISSVIEGIVDKLLSDQMSENKVSINTKPEITLRDKLKAFIKETYHTGASFIVSISSKAEKPDYERPTILENSFFEMVNTITNFSARRPILGCLLGVLRKVSLSKTRIARKIDSVARRYISSKILNSSSLNDENSAKIIEQLRIKLFDKSDTKSEDQRPPSDIEELTDKLYQLLSGNNIQSKYLKSIYSYLINETNVVEEEDNELKIAIKKFLMVLNFDSKSTNNLQVNESSSLNKLLVIKLLDCLIGNLYPEFT